MQNGMQLRLHEPPKKLSGSGWNAEAQNCNGSLLGPRSDMTDGRMEYIPMRHCMQRFGTGKSAALAASDS